MLHISFSHHFQYWKYRLYRLLKSSNSVYAFFLSRSDSAKTPYPADFTYKQPSSTLLDWTPSYPQITLCFHVIYTNTQSDSSLCSAVCCWTKFNTWRETWDSKNIEESSMNSTSHTRSRPSATWADRSMYRVNKNWFKMFTKKKKQ